MKNHGREIDTDISIQELSPDYNKLHYHDKIFSLDNMKKRKMFSSDSTYIHNGKSGDVPKNLMNVDQKIDSEEIITLFKNTSGDIDTITITNRKDGSTIEFTRLKGKIYAAIKRDYVEPLTAIDFGVPLEQKVQELEDVDEETPLSNATQKMACSSYRQIDIALAYESTFCAANGGVSNVADLAATNLIAGSSTYFQQDGLCIILFIRHLEGYCNPNSDIYKEHVDTGLSGCSNDGLIDGFQEIWLADRKLTRRDIALLFTGQVLQCINGECINGCVYDQGICTYNSDQDNGFAVMNPMFTSDFTTQSIFITHEMAHTCGALHENVGGNAVSIMSENYLENGFANSFSQTSIDRINKILENKNCVKAADANLIPDCRNSSLRGAFALMAKSWSNSTL